MTAMIRGEIESCETGLKNTRQEILRLRADLDQQYQVQRHLEWKRWNLLDRLEKVEHERAHLRD